MNIKISVYTDGSADNIKKDKGGIGVFFMDETYEHLNLSDNLNTIDLDIGKPTMLS